MRPGHYRPAFGPEELESLAAAYDAAWRELSASDLGWTSSAQTWLAKRRLAERILASASTERNLGIQELKERALRSWRKIKLSPFRAYGGFFGPEELETMTAAYDAAWQHLWSSAIALSPSEAQSVKRKLAQVILATACTGSRDFERLKDAALRALSRARLSEALDGPAPMPRGDPKECRENAFRCARLAARAKTTQAKETFSRLAQTWVTLAIEIEQSHALADESSAIDG